MPKRIQQRRTKGWRKPEGAVSVARPSKWGNPWKVSDGMSRKGAVWRYRDAVTGELGNVWPGVPTVDEIRAELRGKDLMCFCPLDQPCHADVLLEIANS